MGVNVLPYLTLEIVTVSCCALLIILSTPNVLNMLRLQGGHPYYQRQVAVTVMTIEPQAESKNVYQNIVLYMV